MRIAIVNFRFVLDGIGFSGQGVGVWGIVVYVFVHSELVGDTKAQ